MEVYVYPTEMWEYLQKNRGKLCCEPQLIAYNAANGIEIYAYADPESECFDFEVISERGTEDYVEIFDEEDAKSKTLDIYEVYIYDDFMDVGSDENYTNEINDREVDLYDATDEFLRTVLDCRDYASLDDQQINKITNNILYALHKAHGFDIYRPAMLSTKDGEMYIERPYKMLTEQEPCA